MGCRFSDGYKGCLLIGKVSLGCPTFRGSDAVSLSAAREALGGPERKRRREKGSEPAGFPPSEAQRLPRPRSLPCKVTNQKHFSSSGKKPKP